MTTYDFVEFDEYEDLAEKGFTAIESALQELVDSCQFIVTSYGTMYSSESVEVFCGKAPGLRYKDSLNIDSYWNIKGGYKTKI